jgi:hypothetical protein
MATYRASSDMRSLSKVILCRFRRQGGRWNDPSGGADGEDAITAD